MPTYQYYWVCRVHLLSGYHLQKDLVRCQCWSPPENMYSLHPADQISAYSSFYEPAIIFIESYCTSTRITLWNYETWELFSPKFVSNFDYFGNTTQITKRQMRNGCSNFLPLFPFVNETMFLMVPPAVHSVAACCVCCHGEMYRLPCLGDRY